MKEIKILLQQLRNFPSNYFVVAQSGSEDEKQGLVIYDIQKEEHGFIETGDTQQVNIK